MISAAFLGDNGKMRSAYGLAGRGERVAMVLETY